MCDLVAFAKVREYPTARHRRKIQVSSIRALRALDWAITLLTVFRSVAGVPAAGVSSSLMTKLLTRRNVGLGALGLATAAGISYSNQQRLRLRNVTYTTRAELPGPSQFTSNTSSSPSSSIMTSTNAPITPLRAVNLRDIGEVDPRLRKGVLYRCSQIYTPDVLKELKVRTVVDLRGRAERKKKGKSAKAVGPPPLMPYEQVESLTAAGPSQSPTAAAAAGALSSQQTAGGPATSAIDSTSSLDENMTVTTLRRPASAVSISSMEGSMSESDTENGNGKGTVRRAEGAEDMAAGLTEGEFTLLPEAERETFNLIPTKEFGLAMLRMPWRVWRGALWNLASFKDPKRPFVDAFADEQLLGFTKYYTIILEHAKKNIAAVMRVFAKEKHLPALVHCAHGKDRTGVVIMLLLMLCDVPHEAIVQDYVQSEVELRKYRESLGLPDPTGATGAVIPLSDVIIASTQETLRAVLAYMDSTYITVDNYLQSCGLSQAEIDQIRRNLLKPGAPAQAPAGAKEQEPLSPGAARAAAEAAIGSGATGSDGPNSEL